MKPGLFSSFGKYLVWVAVGFVCWAIVYYIVVTVTGLVTR